MQGILGDGNVQSQDVKGKRPKRAEIQDENKPPILSTEETVLTQGKDGGPTV